MILYHATRAQIPKEAIVYGRFRKNETSVSGSLAAGESIARSFAGDGCTVRIYDIPEQMVEDCGEMLFCFGEHGYGTTDFVNDDEISEVPEQVLTQWHLDAPHAAAQIRDGSLKIYRVQPRYLTRIER